VGLTIKIEQGNRADVYDLEWLLHAPKTMIVEKKVGRSEFCACGSVKEFKISCGKSVTQRRLPLLRWKFD